MDPAITQWVMGGVLLGVVGAIGYQARTVINTAARVSKLEAEMEANNVKEEVGQVHRRVDKVVELSSENKGQLQQINRTLGLIQQHLMGGD